MKWGYTTIKLKDDYSVRNITVSRGETAHGLTNWDSPTAKHYQNNILQSIYYSFLNRKVGNFLVSAQLAIRLFERLYFAMWSVGCYRNQKWPFYFGIFGSYLPREIGPSHLSHKHWSLHPSLNHFLGFLAF